MTTYKVYGQVRKECSKHGHWTIRFAQTEDDTYRSRDKLENIHEHMKARFNKSETVGGLIRPVFDKPEVKEINVKHPYSDGEFVVKVPRYMRECLPDAGTYVTLTIKPKAYKFEKNKYQYIGWRIILKKFEVSQYIL